MFRIASKISSRISPKALVSLTAKPSPISFRSFNTGLALDKSLAIDDVVRMSAYALRQARSEKSVGSYGMGYLVLKHCLTTELTEGNDPKHENSKGIALLAMSTLFSERGDYVDAIEQLDGVQELTNSYLGIRVAAFEAQAGLHLELEQDDMASAVADKCIELVENEKTKDFEALNVRARALKGLIELVKGDIKSAEPYFDKSLRTKLCEGTAALSYAEFQQTRQNYSMAKEIYQNVIEGAADLKESGNVYLGGGNMNMEGLIMGAMCALGQLESHLGNFRNAEEHLTKALTKAEEIYGEKHPKVGVVLTCMALMYRRKAIDQKSSSLMVQEGLYRKISGILKFPSAETESEGNTAAAPTVKKSDIVTRSDIVALASGGYAEVLNVQEKRTGEGEKLKNLSDSSWKNNRMSLEDYLGNTEANLCPVIDARICRLL
ncbi:uncharacterized protein LOC131640918 [Vicia villosa]|uniref:uncharacterized protein LOC131640918 n=1 Tax=Vicia villosa TaxID=3911 RepID=UPI00273C2842|nr:uncharacterized protein LOC131640918 [Vicia villosa]